MTVAKHLFICHDKTQKVTLQPQITSYLHQIYVTKARMILVMMISVSNLPALHKPRRFISRTALDAIVKMWMKKLINGQKPHACF